MRAQIERNLPRSMGDRSFANCSSRPFRIPRGCACWRCRCSFIRGAASVRWCAQPECPSCCRSASRPWRRCCPRCRSHSFEQLPRRHSAQAAPRRRVGHVERMRAAGLLSARECRHRARAGRGRLRSRHSREPALLRRAHAPLRPGRRSRRAGEEDDRRLRSREGRHDRRSTPPDADRR